MKAVNVSLRKWVKEQLADYLEDINPKNNLQRKRVISDLLDRSIGRNLSEKYGKEAMLVACLTLGEVSFSHDAVEVIRERIIRWFNHRVKLAIYLGPINEFVLIQIVQVFKQELG